jgi:hypothetical protein
MGDKLHPSLVEFKGQGRKGTAGLNGSLSRQVHTANAAPLFDFNVFDIAIGLDLKTDHGVNGLLQLAQRGFQPVLPYPLFDLADVPGVHRTLAGAHTDGDALTLSKAAARAWNGTTGSTTTRVGRLWDRPRAWSWSRSGGRWRSPFWGTFLFKNLFTYGSGLLDRGRGDCLRTRDNRRFVHPGAPVHFTGESDSDEISPLSAPGTSSDHDRIAGWKQVHGEGENQDQGDVSSHGSCKG